MADQIEDARLVKRKAQQAVRSKAWAKANPEKCKAAAKRSYEKNKAKKNAYTIAWNKRKEAEDPARCAALRKAWRDRRRDALREADNRRYHKDVEESRAKARAHYAANAERMRARSAKWSKDHPELARATRAKVRHKRRAAIKSGTGESFTLSQIRELRLSTGNRCAYCKVKSGKLTIDHIVALTKGGSNSIRNIQFLCLSCNSKKGDKDPIAYAQSIGMLL